MEKKRVLWMDIAKTIGILIVLIVHAQISLGPVTFFGGMFYMPVFFVLAGMTFRYQPEERFGSFLKKKAKRLLVPYLGYNLFLFLFFFVKDNLLSGQVTKESFFPLLGILYSRNCLYEMGNPDNVFFMQILNAPTWFLTGLFVTLAVFWLMMKVSKGTWRRLLCCNGAVLLIAVLLHKFCPVLLPWSFDCAVYAVAFVTFGKAAKEYHFVEKTAGSLRLLFVVLVAFVGLSMINGSVNMSVAEYGNSMLLYLVVGSLGSLLCMVISYYIEKYILWLARPSAWIGRHTIPVLCLHLFVYSVVGTILQMLR